MLCKIDYDHPLKTSSPMFIDYWKELDRKAREEISKD